MWCRWAASGGFPGLASLYTALLDTLTPINPGALYLLQGTGQLDLTQSGGAGFASDYASISAFNLSDPTSFFKQLLFKTYVNQARPVSIAASEDDSERRRWLCV